MPLRKRVAVKLLRAELCGDAALVERLHVEARCMAALDHPNIAAVHHVGESPEGRPYLVLDYLSGRTLGQELKARGPLPLREAARIVLEVLDGLRAAHAAGLVHRDIKLPNIFLCDPDRHGRRVVKILDFGIAKVRTSRMPRAFPTEQGHFLGSPATASPEQARGEDVDAREDVYATGILLYMLVAGKSPYADVVVPQSMLWAHVLAPPVPLSKAMGRAMPPVLEMIVEKALAKRPDDRYATAGHMAAALERLLAKLPPEADERAGSGVDERARARGAHGTVVLGEADEPAAGRSGAEPPDDAATLRAGRAVAERGLRARLRRTLRRVGPALLIAVGSGAVFFVLLAVVWRILGRSP